MIRFDRSALTTIFYWEGGILPEIVRPALFYLGWVSILELFQSTFGRFELALETSSLSALMSFLVFLLVFRVNSTLSSHRHTALEFSTMFSTLESIINTSCSAMHGASLQDDPETQQSHAEMAILAKLNTIRITLAYAVGLVFHAAVTTSVTEDQGEMSDQALSDLVFLHHRMQGLLYYEEMQLLEKAMCIYKEEVHQPEQVEPSDLWGMARRAFQGSSEQKHLFRGASSGHMPMGHGNSNHERVFGNMRAFAFDDNDTVVPIPKIMAIILLSNVMQPACQPWGYPERFLSIFTPMIDRLVRSMSVVHTMCTLPTPLPYVQLTHLLICVFAFFYPLSLESGKGLLDTCIMPTLIFMTMQAFETLAKMLETATGHDVTDLNFYEMIHTLEVQAQYAFETTQLYASGLQQAWMRPIDSFNLEHARKHRHHRQAFVDDIPSNFLYYFHWLPIPTLILENLLVAHGHVDVLQQAAKTAGRVSIRKMLRQSVTRVHTGQAYNIVEDQQDHDGVDSSMLDSLKRDPNIFSHYLVFNGVHSLPQAQIRMDSRELMEALERSKSKLSHSNWKAHLRAMVEDRPVAALFGDGDGSDTGRSAIHSFRSRSFNPSQEAKYQDAAPCIGVEHAVLKEASAETSTGADTAASPDSDVWVAEFREVDPAGAVATAAASASAAVPGPGLLEASPASCSSSAFPFTAVGRCVEHCQSSQCTGVSTSPSPDAQPSDSHKGVQSCEATSSNLARGAFPSAVGSQHVLTKASDGLTDVGALDRGTAPTLHGSRSRVSSAHGQGERSPSSETVARELVAASRSAAGPWPASGHARAASAAGDPGFGPAVPPAGQLAASNLALGDGHASTDRPSGFEGMSSSMGRSRSHSDTAPGV